MVSNLRRPATCAGANSIDKRFSDIPVVIGCLRFGSGREGSPFPVVDKDRFWFTSGFGGHLIVPYSMTLYVPGRDDLVEGLGEKAGAPLS